MINRGFHEVTLVDMGDTPRPDVYMADLSLLRLQWPVPVVSSMSWLQPELEQLCRACKTREENQIGHGQTRGQLPSGTRAAMALPGVMV